MLLKWVAQFITNMLKGLRYKDIFFYLMRVMTIHL